LEDRSDIHFIDPISIGCRFVENREVLSMNPSKVEKLETSVSALREPRSKEFQEGRCSSIGLLTWHTSCVHSKGEIALS